MTSVPISDPRDIEHQSMAIIDREVPDPRPVSAAQWPVLRRMIHASADFELLSLVRFHPQAVQQGIQALRSGCRILTDTRMVRAGITDNRMRQLECRVQCLLDMPDIEPEAQARGATRSRVGMEKAAGIEAKTLFVIGNAPTALFALIELIRSQKIVPELIVGMPVGFVGAAESKQELMQLSNVPWITVTGRKGGSPLAAACVNALAALALQSEAS